jgi:alkylation response protein AidB-like acyl-CoA dehydrogenase
MRFAFTDDQLGFRDAVRDLLAKECAPDVVRAAWSGSEDRTAWRALGEMGVLGLLAGEELGGLGLGMVDLVLPLEETGYAALPEPIVEHACAAMPLLGSPGPALDGTETVTAGVGDVVPFATRADQLLVLDAAAARLLVAADVTLVRLSSVDRARDLARVDAGGVGTAVGAEEADRARDRGALGAAAQLVGLARRMLDLTVAYVVERRQFGVPIGSFQAVKHHLADARIALEFARPLVYRAAWSVQEHDPDASIHVSMAKASASDAALLMARQALQCHGAIGYSFEYDLHLFMKRAWALASDWGDARWHRARVERAILS